MDSDLKDLSITAPISILVTGEMGVMMPQVQHEGSNEFHNVEIGDTEKVEYLDTDHDEL